MDRLLKILMGLNPDLPIPEAIQETGWGDPELMITMIGYKRLKNIEELINKAIELNLKGNIIETGVWRGGATIFMRECLNKLCSQKIVYVADSFKGLPEPDEKYIHDKGDYHHKIDFLSVSLKEVIMNFKKHSNLKNVKFVKGWFKDTLHKIDDDFCIIRLDGDMYESTMDSLAALYPKLVTGGYCIIDDMNCVYNCKQAVLDFREQNSITNEMITVDNCAIYWIK